jgi:hypothetical protein
VFARLRRRFGTRLAEMGEGEAYIRCHGARGNDVRVVRLERRRPRYELPVSGEDLRQRFQERLDARESAADGAAGDR